MRVVGLDFADDDPERNTAGFGEPVARVVVIASPFADADRYAERNGFADGSPHGSAPGRAERESDVTPRRRDWCR